MPSGKMKVTSVLILTTILFLMVNSVEAITYVYDQANRLKEVHFEDSTWVEYTYDDVGNRLQETFHNEFYPIVVTAGAGGTISPSSTNVVYGGSQTFTITPDNDHLTVDVLVDGTSVGAVSTYTFRNVTTGHSISAVFAANGFTITATAGPNGSISPSGTRSVSYGEDYTVRITPDIGYNVADVVVDGVSQGPMPQSLLTSSDNRAQALQFNPPGTSYTFRHVTADHTIFATFAAQTYIINASAGPNGSISPLGTVTVDFGNSQTFTITPATGYKVADVLVDGISLGPITSYTFSDSYRDHTISATFAADFYTITATAGANGSISPSGVVSANHGDSLAFTVIPNNGYQVADVLIDGVSHGPITSYTFTSLSTNHSIFATFTISNYIISASAGENGAISPSGPISVNYGANQTFAITPNTGYHVVDVVADGVSHGPITSYTFSNVTGGHDISATFAVNTFTISASAGANGAITPSGAVSVNYGANQSFTITPNTGYHVADVVVDGASQGAITSYTFSNAKGAHSISATFAIDTFTVSASAGENGAITPSGAVSVNYGASQAFTITPSSGYTILDVVVDGVSQGPVATYIFTNVTANHTISASFTNAPIKNARTGTRYSSLQAAYDAALNGDTILCQNVHLSENFSANRDISLTIDGGYDSVFNANPENTILVGAPVISSGTLTWKNFIISN